MLGASLLRQNDYTPVFTRELLYHQKIMLELLQNWLIANGVADNFAIYVAHAIAVLAVLILSATANFIANQYTTPAIARRATAGILVCRQSARQPA